MNNLNNKEDIVINGIYKHYKGNMYQVLSIGKDSETNNEVVIYKALYGNNQIWVRPKDMFLENVLVDNKIVKRFSLIEK